MSTSVTTTRMAVDDEQAAAVATPSTRMNDLERRAKAVRKKLLRTIDALDQRRHDVVEIGHDVVEIGNTAKKLALPAALSIVGIAVLFGASVFAMKMALDARRDRSLSYRAKRRVKKLLAELEIGGTRPSLGRRVVEKVTLSLVGIATTEIARRATKAAAAADDNTANDKLLLPTAGPTGDDK